ncbi:hypothetical protein [Fimbriimonas ginsengisoli]|uniref:Uncharacterized protein n=1 Tax=Fimbriimonas ginsengisoli Gsoil 348 TaxID=661478 RepID=A0A068NT16_FIMGI|nr:hypothetical protein [Fimbriimonas ginsengisoli]AIE86492.1 hypothetical protein OP10G_3124 [Fimbriimonas ginsengisoli Gsoil 348]
MPVSVSVPTKIRIDRTALADHPEWIEEAVSAAVGRAMANSRRSVLDARGGYLGVSLHAPNFSWRGIDVAERDRIRLEEAIARIVKDAAAVNGLLDGPGPNVPPVLPPDPSEPFDSLRAFPIAGVYTLDSYDGGTEDVQVVDEKHPLLYDYVPVVNVFLEPMTEEVRFALTSVSYDASPEHPLGVIYRFVKGGGIRWHVLITDGYIDSDDPESPAMAHLVGAFEFEGFTRFDFMGENASPMFKKVFYAPPPGPGTAEVIDVPADDEGRKKKYKELMGSGLEDNLRRHSRKPISMTTTKFQEKIGKRVDDEIDLALKNVQTNVTKAVKVTLGSSEVFVWMTKDDEQFLQWNGRATLTALDTVVKRPKPPKKKGEGSGSGGNEGGSSSGGEGQTGGAKGGTGGGGTGGGCGCAADDQPRDPWKEIFGEDGPSMECRSLRGEPALEEIGDAGELLGNQIKAIAQKLGISECVYAGQFCYQAASQLNDKAIATQSMAESSSGDNKAADGKSGNLGSVSFAPGSSAVIDTIRDLAGAVPLISQLMATAVDVFCSDTFRCTIHGSLRGNGQSWSLKFLSDVGSKLNEAVGNLFIGACRSMLLQLLATSLDQINKRLNAIDRYAPLFEKWILPQITDLAELDELHTRLRNYGYGKKAQEISGGILVASAAGWDAAASRLVSSLIGGAVVRSVGEAYEIVQDGGVDKIRGSTGVLWTIDDLEQAIALRRGLAEGIDPLVKQITDTPDAVKRFKGTDSIRRELETLLKEMVSNNEEMRGKADRDPMFAFKASSISEDIPQATVRGGKYSLQGIHRVAHEQIYDAFLYDSFYATGLDYLFDTEEGKAAIIGFGILAGFVLLCVLVPGGAFIAFVAGGALAVHEVSKAYEKKRLYGALINPDLVLSHAEVEVGLFVAWFGLVLSLIPEAGTAAKGLVSGGRAVLKGEAKAIGKMAAKAVGTRVAKELAEYAVKDLLEAFVKELTINIVIDQVIQKSLAPVVKEIQNESSIGFGSGGGAEAPDADQADFLDMIRALESLDQEGTADDDGGSPDVEGGDDEVPYEEVLE